MKILLRTALLSSVVASGLLTAQAQNDVPEAPTTKGFYIGMSAGMDWSNLYFSKIDKSLYPKNNNDFSGMFSFFGQYNFGKNGNFGIRPEFAFLTRGGRLSDIGRGILDEYKHDPEIEDDIFMTDYFYRLKATYFDIRVPLIYTIGKNSWNFRPYVYVAPILGFAHKGYIAAQQDFSNNNYIGSKYDLSKSNYNSFMFSGALGIGLNYYFNIKNCRFFVGIEANYQLGFTDTYSSREKNGEVKEILQLFPDRNIKAEGSRRINTWEVKATIGIPVSIFCAPKKQVKYVEIVEEEEIVAPVVSQPVEKKEEVGYQVKPCYSLDEIMDMINKNQSIEGKRICAIEEVQFDTNKSVIKKNSFNYLNKLAKLIKSTGAKVKVQGHTDNTGTVERNDVLSHERAEAVMEYLIRQGVDPEKLSCASYGSSRPRATNDTEQGRRMNRRVEFDIE